MDGILGGNIDKAYWCAMAIIALRGRMCLGRLAFCSWRRGCQAGRDARRTGSYIKAKVTGRCL